MKEILKFIGELGLPLLLLIVLFLLDPYNKGYLIGYLLIPFAYLGKEHLLMNMDMDYLILLIFSLVYGYTYSLQLNEGVGKQFIFIYAIFPSTFYMLGKKLVRSKMTYNSIFYLLFFLGFFFSLTALLSVGKNLLEGGFIQIDRTIPLFWNGKLLAATAMGAYFTFNMCIPGILIVNYKKLSPLFILFALIVFVISMLCVFRLGSRTQIVICIISIVISLISVVPRQNIKSNFQLILLLTILVVVVFKFIPLDLDADYLSVLGERLQESDNASSAGGRTARWSKSIQNIFEKPFGWNLDEFGYSHNFWLDVARFGGIAPFLLLCIFTFRCFIKIRRTLKLYKKALLFNTSILVYSIASFLIFFVEPIMEGLFFLFVMFCLYQGILNAYLQQAKTTINSE